MLVIQSEALTAQLNEVMENFEKDCRTVVDADTYIVPDHIQVAEVPWMKRAAWAVVGFVLQPFRILI